MADTEQPAPKTRKRSSRKKEPEQWEPLRHGDESARSVPSGAPVTSRIAADPDRDEVARRAYQIYLRKGQPEGHDLENWLEAERELKAERRSGRTGG